MKKSFILYNDQVELINELTDIQAGQLLRVLYQYSNSASNDTIQDPSVKMAFIAIKSQLDRDAQKYSEVCEKNKENISKRWNKKDTTVYDRIPPDTKHTDTDNDTGTVNDTDNEKEQKKTLSSCKPNGACPHQDIIELYHTILPELPQVRTWPESNQKILRTRWKEEPERQVLTWWDAYFRYIHESAFLTGRETDFTADLEWVVRPKNMTKILNGRYHKQKHGGIMAWLTEMQGNSPES